MATISKDSLAQFWLNSFPISSNNEYLSFTDSKIVNNLWEFISDKNDEKKIFELIQQIKPKKISNTSPPKRRKTAKMSDTNQIPFKVKIKVIEKINDE